MLTGQRLYSISALTEGCSIRATERLTGIHRDTIMRLGVRIGEGCKRLHDGMMRDLNVPILECDEIWSFIGKKQRRTDPSETEKGDQYTYLAMDATRKTIISYKVGKRNPETTQLFIDDLWERVAHVQVAVGVGRAVVEQELLAPLGGLAQAREQVHPVPARQNLRLAFGQPGTHGKSGARRKDGGFIIDAHGAKAYLRRRGFERRADVMDGSRERQGRAST